MVVLRIVLLLGLALLLTIPTGQAWMIQRAGGPNVDVGVIDKDGGVRPCVGIQYDGSGLMVDTTDGVIIYTGPDAPRGYAGYTQSGPCPHSEPLPLLEGPLPVIFEDTEEPASQ